MSASAPDFTLTGGEGRPVRLSGLWSQGPLLLVFYPGDDTAVCTAQLCEYRDRWADFRAAGVQVVGINPAPAARHQRFASRHHFPFPMLSDPDQACSKAYGAKAWYGTRRVTVLIAKGGQEVWRRATWPFLRPRADELLGAVRNLTPRSDPRS